MRLFKLMILAALNNAAALNLRTLSTSQKLQLLTYFNNWDVYAKNYQPEQVPDSVTGAPYGFAEVGNCATPYGPDVCNTGAYATGVQDWKVYSTDPYSDFNTVPVGAGYNLEGTAGLGNMGKLINQMHKSSRPALLSVGGYTLSWQVFEAMKAEHRTTYVNSMVDFLKLVQEDAGVTFDGVDTDIEPDNAQWTFLNDADALDRLNDILATASLMRTTLQAEFGPEFQLTAAWPASPAIIQQAETVMPGFWQAWLDQLSSVNTMTYDYHGAFDSPAITNFNAPATYDPAQPADVSNRDSFNTQSTLEAYKAALPNGLRKMNLGLPLYGRGLKGVPAGLETCPGTYQTFSGAWTDADHPEGMYSIDEVQTMVADGTLTACYVEAAGQWTAYGKVNGENVWISYDTADSVTNKLDYVTQYNMGGAFMWTASDDQTGAYTNAVATYLFNETAPAVNPASDSSNTSPSVWTDQNTWIGTAAGVVTGVVGTLFVQHMGNRAPEGYTPIHDNSHS
jgi:chitinase